jgi:hypothetical protein
VNYFQYQINTSVCLYFASVFLKKKSSVLKIDKSVILCSCDTLFCLCGSRVVGSPSVNDSTWALHISLHAVLSNNSIGTCDILMERIQ